METCRLVRGRVAAAWLVAVSSLGGVLTAAPNALANAPCRVESGVAFSYPSIDGGTTLPRNAQLLFVTSGGSMQSRLWWQPDGGYSTPEIGTHFDRFRFVVGDRLSVGEHEATLLLDSSDFVLVGPEEHTLRFTVSDELAPPPDETGTAVITRVSRVRQRDGAIVVEDEAWASAALADPADCSEIVGLQSFCVYRNLPARAGEYLLELEAEGPVLGFAIDDTYFLPAHCRSAFVPEARRDGVVLTHRLRVVTETGLGSAIEYAGEVEDTILPDPDPYVEPDRPRPPVCSTSAGGRGGRQRLLGNDLLGLPLLGLLALLRRARCQPLA